MLKKLICTITLLAALLISSCAIFITDTDEPLDDDEDSVTIIIH